MPWNLDADGHLERDRLAWFQPPDQGRGQQARPQVSRSRLFPLGVFEVCGAERITIEGRKSASVLAPIAMADL